MMAAVDDVPDVSFTTDEDDLDVLRDGITTFLRRRVDGADSHGVVVCMSGGVDSTLTAHLCVDALGPEQVTALLLPCTLTDAENTLDAHAAARRLELEPTMVQLQPLLDTFEDLVAPAVDVETDRVALGNVVARLRMTVAYYAANVTGRLVCGTSNRTELLLGYFTKYGDGAADLRPIAGLYKTEVRALARHVGVPPRIVDKTSTADLWAGQTDEGELGAPYGLLDVLLHELVDEDLGVEAAAAEIGVDGSVVRRYADRLLESEHKRRRAPTPETDRSEADELFCELEDRVRGRRP